MVRLREVDPTAWGVLLALAVMPLASCGCVEKAFDMIELGKPLPKDGYPEGTVISAAGAAYSFAEDSSFPLYGTEEHLRALADSNGLVWAKGMHVHDIRHWLVVLTYSSRFVCEFEVPEDWFSDCGPETKLPLEPRGFWGVRTDVAGMGPASRQSALGLPLGAKVFPPRVAPKDRSVACFYAAMLVRMGDQLPEDRFRGRGGILLWFTDPIRIGLAEELICAGAFSQITREGHEWKGNVNGHNDVRVRHLGGRRIRVEYSHGLVSDPFGIIAVLSH